MPRKPKPTKHAANPPAKAKRKREPVISANADRCPRCGESVAILLRHSYYGGKRRYLCVSEDCKANSITGKGRQFVVMPR